MTDLPTGWQAVATLQDLPAEGLHEIVVGRHLVLLVRRGGALLAVQGLCPHQAARLVGGRLDDQGWLHCPHHQARFRLADGACGPGWRLPALRRFETRVEAGMVLLPDPLAPLP
ncbi:Ferredoxin subunit of nitrite reductase or a ring-hydroxylating dioxygenase [Tistlia consotensis]|uniref:3-phenylpropionate/trans-cinnamate dioxygenase ferredoxin subunit n=1 Tax=Tistlia consotensis USBA 355 TaxID=560819 RepID=A0A1Y6BZB6_9PROT|nr:Rieske 2Fe-2S domain-containing protein [Tistlia consotensis]SMF37161.1 3-phenylpropionate/trans-cinnamate dioxygenase ferredoxin subunit [Tistlia consotensis USBA 355]SNR72510.1 Ferredoxin subunit of nitrite reductase or a ring-hydroxylating dioxygenase [Tistlia consotensis]